MRRRQLLIASMAGARDARFAPYQKTNSRNL